MIQTKDSGSISLAVLVVLLAVSIIAFGVGGIVNLSIGQVKKAESQDILLSRLRGAAEVIADTLAADPTPKAQAAIDPVYQAISDLAGELQIDIVLEDLSARVGVNWIRKEVIDGIGLLGLYHGPDEFQQYREDIGFRLVLDEPYYEFFEEDTIEELITPYSFWNVNISDEFTLEELCASRTGDTEKGESFRMQIQDFRMQERTLLPDDLADFLGEGYKPLVPVVIAEPPLNIHFVDDVLLDKLCRYFDAPAGIAARIRSARAKEELTVEWLASAFEGADYDEILLQYIGVKSWFWRIELEESGTRLEWIVCRVPGRVREGDGMEIRLIQESVERQ